MQRRHFFRSLIGASGAVGATAAAQTILPHQLEVQGADYLRWKGVLPVGIDVWPYKVVWTGWKSDPCSARLLGQWVATPLSGYHYSYAPGHRHGLPSLVSSHPGIAGPFIRGMEFWTGAFEGQYPLMLGDPDEEIEVAQRETFALLHQIIHGYNWTTYGQLDFGKRTEIQRRIDRQSLDHWQRFVRNPH